MLSQRKYIIILTSFVGAKSGCWPNVISRCWIYASPTNTAGWDSFTSLKHSIFNKAYSFMASVVSVNVMVSRDHPHCFFRHIFFTPYKLCQTSYCTAVWKWISFMINSLNLRHPALKILTSCLQYFINSFLKSNT